jgi:hypothetical protein
MVTKHKTQMKPTIWFWCPFKQKFRCGPGWVDYKSGVRRLERGFQILWNGELCVFSGDHWMVGNLEVSIAGFHEKLRESDPDASIEAALSRTTQNPFPKDDILAMRSFLGRPISTLLFLHLNAVIEANKVPYKAPKKATYILCWRFDRDNATEDQLRRIQLLVEWRGGREAAHVSLSWESEEMLHAGYETLLLGFWKRVGGREQMLRREG